MYYLDKNADLLQQIEIIVSDYERKAQQFLEPKELSNLYSKITFKGTSRLNLSSNDSTAIWETLSTHVNSLMEGRESTHSGRYRINEVKKYWANYPPHELLIVPEDENQHPCKPEKAIVWALSDPSDNWLGKFMSKHDAEIFVSQLSTLYQLSKT